MSRLYFDKTLFITLIFFNILKTSVIAQADFFAKQRAQWLQTAHKTRPTLHETLALPVGTVRLQADSAAFQGWKALPLYPPDSVESGPFRQDKSGMIVDFGRHLTGYFTFTVAPWRSPMDAPLRLRFTFAEMPSELAFSPEPFRGDLSRAWIQDEVVTVTQVPATITIPRRLAFRYVKVDLLGSSKFADFHLKNLQVRAVSSVGPQVRAVPLPGGDALVQRIDQIALYTLRECMQTVYEDGPKRDARLWIGDLYLGAIANQQTFQQHTLTKHCLYLLAALADTSGYLFANVFERPEPHPQINRMIDYALIYNAVLNEYLKATGDRKTALALWPVAARQVELSRLYLNAQGLINFEAASKNWWAFGDWREGLDKHALLQGTLIWTLQHTEELARKLGKEAEANQISAQINQMRTAARQAFYDAEKGLFVSGAERQVSVASQAWMALAGVASPQEGRAALAAVLGKLQAVQPGTPYLTHFVIEALIAVGMETEARQLLRQYWQGMVQKNADTFWEVYDPKNDFHTPYNAFLLNSQCHIWSSTPVYFFRKYPNIFLK